MNPSQLGRTGEALTIDQNTNEIKGQTTGKVYGKGANLQEALALQTQIQSGGTPNVAGRPDLYATTPTAAEKPYQPIQTPAGMVKPTVATPAQLAQASAGTLPSFNTTYPKPVTPPTAPTMTTDATLGREDAKIKAMTEAAKLGAQKGLESRLNAGDSYDQQLLVQKAALLGSLFGERLTPEDLRFLSPSQQEAVRNADKSAIQAHLASLNSIAQGRKDLRAEQEAKMERETAKNLAVAKTTFQLYSDNNMWDKLDASARLKLETSLGLPSGTIDNIANNQANNLYNYQYKDGLGNSIIELVTDKKTGKLISSRTIGSSGTGVAGGAGGSFVIPQQSKKDIPTFEEFLKQKEDEAQMSFGERERTRLKEEYDKLYGSTKDQGQTLKDYSDQFESVVINLGSVSSQNNARKYFQDLINKGDTTQMNAYLNRLAKDGLTGKAKTDFDAMGSVSSGANLGLSMADSFAVSNPGLYKTAIESAKPLFNVSKDQNWVNFTSKIQAAQAGFINALYGAALTDSEQARANMFTVDFQTDNIETVKTKLRNLRDLSSEVRTRLLNEERGIFGEESLGAKPSLDMFVSDINQFIR